MRPLAAPALAALVAMLAASPLAHAQELKLDERIPGWIPVAGEARFTFPVPADDVYTFQAGDGSGGQGSVDTVIRVVAADGLVLAANDDSGSGLDSESVLRLAAGETVELLVREYGDAGGPITATVARTGTAPPLSPGDALPELPEGTCDIEGGEVCLADLRGRAVLLVLVPFEEDLPDRAGALLSDAASGGADRLEIILLLDVGGDEDKLPDISARARDGAWAWRTVVLRAGALGDLTDSGLDFEHLLDQFDTMLWDDTGEHAQTGVAILADRDGTIRAASVLSDPLVARALDLAAGEPGGDEPETPESPAPAPAPPAED